MVLEFPARASKHLGEAERLRELRLPIAVRRRLPVLYWVQRRRRVLTVGILVFAVIGFSGAWTGGALVLDGPGLSLYVRLALDHLGAERTVPYWLPDLWAGAPVWVVTPTLPVFLLVPLATALGPDVAVKLGVLGVQVLGACGTFLLARSLWKSYPAAIVAGVLFALQPLIISHGALAGSQPTVAVMAVAPWLVWSLRRGLRGHGPGYLAGAGLLAGFAVVMQAEYAMGLVLLGGCLLAVEAGQAGAKREPADLKRLLTRAGAVVAVGLGVAAYRLLPFAALRTSFVRSRPGMAPGDLFTGGGAPVGRELGAFFGRTDELTGVVGFDLSGLLPLLFHLGWVCLALTLVSVVFLADRDRDGTLTAVLLSAALGVWLSIGAVPLASGGSAARTQVVPFVMAGLAAGLLLGALLRRLRLGRRAPILLGGMFAFLVALPYLTPVVTLQKLLPFLESVRVPRLYTVAPLALALGAAYTVTLAQEWAERHRARSAPAALPAALAGAVALAVLGVFLVDVWPYRSYYRIRPPATAAAYQAVAANLAPRPGTFRIAPTEVDPTAVDSLLDTGRALSVGWPHGVAGTQAWRLTAEPLLAPVAYRNRALGLSATAFLVTERSADRGTASETVPAIDLAENPPALPLVRAYNRTVAVAGRDITPELAVGLAYRNIGVFTGSPAAGTALAATTVVDVRSKAPCEDDSDAGLDPGLASLLGVACGLHTWLGTLSTGVDLVDVEQGAGAVFRPTTDGLRGISAYLDRDPDRAEVALYEVLAGGRSRGPELARGKAVGTDENGMVAFTFDPIPDSAGKEYAFVLTCPGCPVDRAPRLVVGHSVDRPGNLLVAGTVRRDRAAAFAPIFEPVTTDAPTTTAVEPTRPGPGRWRVRANGVQPALVVVAEAWFPGWEARVDGRKVPVVEADGGFLGVPVDAGDHLVTLEYHRPGSAVVGRLITAATLLILAGLALRRRQTLSGLRGAFAGESRVAAPPEGEEASGRLPRPPRPLRSLRPTTRPRRMRPASPSAPPSGPHSLRVEPTPPAPSTPSVRMARRTEPPRPPTAPPPAGRAPRPVELPEPPAPRPPAIRGRRRVEPPKPPTPPRPAVRTRRRVEPTKPPALAPVDQPDWDAVVTPHRAPPKDPGGDEAAWGQSPPPPQPGTAPPPEPD